MLRVEIYQNCATSLVADIQIKTHAEKLHVSQTNWQTHQSISKIEHETRPADFTKARTTSEQKYDDPNI